MNTIEGATISRATVSPHKFLGDPMAEYVYGLDCPDEDTSSGVGEYLARFGRRLLFEDNQGFVTVVRHASEQIAADIFDAQSQLWDNLAERDEALV